MIGSPRRRRDPRQPYRPAQLNLLREVKIDTPVHRLWAGTKLLAVTGISVVLSYFPSWGSLGVMTALLLVTVLAARIPPGAWPRPPVWFWIAILITGGLASLAGGAPHVRIGGMDFGLGGLDAYCRFVGVGMVLLLTAAVIGWTTSLGDIAPAIATLMWPLKLVRVPVEEAATAVALAVRSLPMLVSEMRSLFAARRLRPAPPGPQRGEVERWLDEVVDLMVAALAVSVRRAGELAEAITARGGTGRIAARTRRPRLPDAVALALAAGVCYAATLFPV